MERAVMKIKIKNEKKRKREIKNGKGCHAGIQNKGSGSKEQFHFCDGDNYEYFTTKIEV